MIQRGITHLRSLAVSAMMMIIAVGSHAAPLIRLSENGCDYSILHLVPGDLTDHAYYRSIRGSAYPSYETQSQAAARAFYCERDHGRLSLLVTVGGAGGDGKVRLAVHSVPPSERLLFIEQAGKVSVIPGLGRLTADLVYKNGSAGFVAVEEVPASRPRIPLQPVADLTSALLADGDPRENRVSGLLDMTRPLLSEVPSQDGQTGQDSLLEDAMTDWRPYAHTLAVALSGGTASAAGNPVPDPGLGSAWVVVTSALSLRPNRRNRSPAR